MSSMTSSGRSRKRKGPDVLYCHASRMHQRCPGPQAEERNPQCVPFAQLSPSSPLCPYCLFSPLVCNDELRDSPEQRESE